MKRSHDNHYRATTMTIHRVGEDERAEVERLAQRDTRPVPRAPLLGVEVGGRLLAVTSIAGGETVADPFSPTAEPRAMLELRAAQLRRAARPRRPLRLGAGRRARASLAGSPPGAGGRLLSL